MGVEPTRDRLTAPPGFEVRSPHRERDSSVWLLRPRRWRKELDARGVDAPHVLAADCKPVPIEELEDLDGDLAAIVQAIAELRRGESAVRSARGDIDGDLGHLLHHWAQEEVILGNLLCIAATRRHAHQAPYEGFIDAHGIGDIAYARRTVGFTGKARSDQGPNSLFLLGEFHLVAWPTYP